MHYHRNEGPRLRVKPPGSVGKMNLSDSVFQLSAAYAEANDSDVLIYSGEIRPSPVADFIQECRLRDAYRKNALLILVTPGGSADDAYRLGRCLQDLYENGQLTVWVTGWCKSAGTLLAIAGHRLVVSDAGELGPLDVQLSKADELFEWNSGLIIDSALDSLQSRAINMFETYFIQIVAKSQGRVTFRTATSIASNMVVNLLSPVYNQIDPIKIGENVREMSVASDYGTRLNQVAENLKSRSSLVTLVQSYCSHGFVIDRKEAADLFRRVDRPDARMRELELELGPVALIPDSTPSFGFLSGNLTGESNDGAVDETKDLSAAKAAREAGNANDDDSNIGGTVEANPASSEPLLKERAPLTT